MPSKLPRSCRPQAFQLFAEAVAEIETPTGLLVAAVALAMHERPDADVEAADATLQEMADAVRRRVPSGDPAALLAHAHAHLFDELGFCGDATCFRSPRGSYLPDVLETRRGLPITLCLVYKLVLDRLGIAVDGVNTPGHFLVTVQDRGRPLLVDPFAGGRVLSRDEAVARARELAGDDAVAEASALPFASHHAWIRRMLRNLHALFLQGDQSDELRAMLELSRLLD